MPLHERPSRSARDLFRSLAYRTDHEFERIAKASRATPEVVHLKRTPDTAYDPVGAVKVFRCEAILLETLDVLEELGVNPATIVAGVDNGCARARWYARGTRANNYLIASGEPEALHQLRIELCTRPNAHRSHDTLTVWTTDKVAEAAKLVIDGLGAIRALGWVLE